MTDLDASSGAATDERNTEAARSVQDSRSVDVAPIIVTLRSAGRGKFTATLDGFPLIERPCSSVIFAACRALVAAGALDGPARFRHECSVHVFDAEVRSVYCAARVVALDRQRSGLSIEPWTDTIEE